MFSVFSASSTPISDSRPPFFELGCASCMSARFLRGKVRAHKMAAENDACRSGGE